MIVGVDHIGIAVNNLEDALKIYRDILGLKLEKIYVAEEDKVKSAMLLAGEIKIELMEPTDEESSVTRFLEKRGEGMHHIALRVKEIESFLQQLKEKGIVLVDEKPRKGVEGGKIAFLHPKSTRKVLLELCEK